MVLDAGLLNTYGSAARHGSVPTRATLCKMQRHGIIALDNKNQAIQNAKTPHKHTLLMASNKGNYVMRSGATVNRTLQRFAMFTFYSTGLVIALAIGGCGGGGGSSDSGSPTYSIGGTVSGLSGSIALANNGSTLTLSADGTFSFPTKVTDGSNYAVTIATQPSGQTCSLANAIGKISGANITNVTVTCAMATPVLSMTPTPTKKLHFSWFDVDGETEYRLLEDSDGFSGYQQIATIAANTTSYDHALTFLPAYIGAHYKLEACDADGCLESAPVSVVDALAGAVGYIKASNTGEGDRFGYSIALSADGLTLAVGSPEEGSSATGINGDQNNEAALKSGAVYVFTYDGHAWSQQAYIKASNTQVFDLFGSSLALSADGTLLAIGAINDDSSATGIDGDQADNSAADSGAVFLFARNGTTWSQQAYVKASNTDAGDNFGSSVALSSDGLFLAVAADHEASNATGVNGNQNDNTALVKGAVYVFARAGNTWNQQAYVKPSSGAIGFAYCLALSSDGSTLAVGTIGDSSGATGVNGDQNDLSASGSGAVFVFTRSGATWSQQAYIKASNTEAFDGFGYSLSLSGDGSLLAVGAWGEDSAGMGANGNQVDNSAADSGAVYVFGRTSNVWAQQAYLKASNTETDDWFGYKVSLSADASTLAVGAWHEGSNARGINGDQSDNSIDNAGSVYLFTNNGAQWSQRAYIKASNTGSLAYFSNSIALSSDGTTLAIGAFDENGAATGINGNQNSLAAPASGAVYIY